MIIFYISVLVFVASLIGTLTGFGTSTVMIPVLLMFFPPAEAISLMAIIHWFGNVWKVALFYAGFDIRLFALFLIIRPKFNIAIGNVTALFGGALSGFLPACSVLAERSVVRFWPLLIYPKPSILPAVTN